MIVAYIIQLPSNLQNTKASLHQPYLVRFPPFLDTLHFSSRIRIAASNKSAHVPSLHPIAMRSIEEKNPKHKARRVALRRLEKQVSGFENAQLDAKELQKARISVQPMSFDDSGPAKFQPSFFAPLPADLLRNPDEIPRDANDPPFFPDFDRELGYFGGNCGPMDRARDLDDFLNNYHGSSFCVKREEDLRGDRR